MFLTLFMLMGITISSAQQKDEDLKTKPIWGVWQYVEEITTADGGKAYIGKPIYKKISEDKTYSVMASINIPIKQENQKETTASTVTFITQEGDIVLGSDNGYLEYINKHYLDSNLNNTISQLRYRFAEDNPNILYLEYNINGSEEGWISEIWVRVMPYGAK